MEGIQPLISHSRAEVFSALGQPVLMHGARPAWDQGHSSGPWDGPSREWSTMPVSSREPQRRRSWWHSTRVPDLTRIEAWSRYIEFLSDAAHAHAPSTVSIEPVGNVNNTYAIEGRVSFDDGTEALATTDTVLSQKDVANGKLGWWHIDAPSFGSTVTLMELDNLRSVRVGDVSIDNPQGWYYLFPGSYRIEAVPQNPDYWTIKYERPLTDGATPTMECTHNS